MGFDLILFIPEAREPVPSPLPLTIKALATLTYIDVLSRIIS